MVAYLDATGRPVTVLNGTGDLLTPSAVSFDDDGVVVGKEAVKSSRWRPSLYVECFKRDMGRPVARRKIRGLEVPPEVLSAFVLERLKQDAERRLGPIRQAVITVPAFFDETRRKATQEAGRLAGLEVLDIINEPTAAAAGLRTSQGFLDLARPAAAAGPHAGAGLRPGGRNLRRHDPGNRGQPIPRPGHRRRRVPGRQGFRRAAGEPSGREVPRRPRASIRAAIPRTRPNSGSMPRRPSTPFRSEPKPRWSASTPASACGSKSPAPQFEELTRDLVERTETTTSLVVKQAGLELVADRSRACWSADRAGCPWSENAAAVTGKEPDCSQSADEAVAHGAALYAGMLMSAIFAEKPACELVNVNSHSLGVVGMHPKTRREAQRGSDSQEHPLALPGGAGVQDGRGRSAQRAGGAWWKGESERPEACIALGECVVRDLPAGLPQGTPIEVEYRYATNGLLAVSARIPSARLSTQVDIKRHDVRDLGDLETCETAVGANRGRK